MRRELPSFRNLGDFVSYLECAGELVRIAEPVSVVREITEIHRRVVRRGGPALLFENALDAQGNPALMPILVNLFGTRNRVAYGLGVTPSELSALGEDLAALRHVTAPGNLADVWRKLPLARAALSMRPKEVLAAPAQHEVLTGDAVDLRRLPAQMLWPDEPAPLITWPLVFTRSPDADRNSTNVGVYRMQVLGRDRAIIRWLTHRGGAHHHRQWQALNRDMPVAVVIGADPATLLAAAMPLPETLSETSFAGLLRGERPHLAPCVSVPIQIPAEAEIVIEGIVPVDERAEEGPYGDHTGYYNSVESFPVLRVTAMTLRRRPVYLSTFTGRPPDEPSTIGETLNDLFLPLVRCQVPEIVDLWFPPEACSYRIAVVSLDKRYPGQARRVMMALWSLLPQFSYTKMIIVVDREIDVRSWTDVMWAVATRFDASRDLLSIDHTPVDYLDFASPRAELGGKLGIDATTKVGAETDRVWGRTLAMDPETIARVDEIWSRLGLPEDVHG